MMIIYALEFAPMYDTFPLTYGPVLSIHLLLFHRISHNLSLFLIVSHRSMEEQNSLRIIFVLFTVGDAFVKNVVTKKK
jgi:hypothetical protein